MWSFKKMRNQEFVPLMKILIEFYQPDVYVEVGVQKGITFNQIAPLVKEAYAVDIMPMPNVNRADNVTIYQVPSVIFANSWPVNKKIDLLFIDADHQKEMVLSDFDLLSPFVTPCTGLILLHDTYPSAPHMLADGYCSSAWEAAREIHQSEKYKDWEGITFPGPFAGLSIFRHTPLDKPFLHWMWE